jgi:hypothetical protein
MGSELGMVTEVREVQPEKAKGRILVTELGMMISVKSLQPKNSCSPILYYEKRMIP